MANHRKATDGGNVYFSRTQLTVVAALFVASSAIIFVLGILIGQSIEERKLLRREEPGVTVQARSGALKDDQKMTFYDTLTQPEPAPPPAAASPSAAAQQPAAAPVPAQEQLPYTLQVAAVQSRADADNMAAALKKRGYPAYVTAGKFQQKTFYRVRVGAYGTRQHANTDLQRLRAADYKNVMIRNR